jgi:hypothetical protein
MLTAHNSRKNKMPLLRDPGLPGVLPAAGATTSAATALARTSYCPTHIPGWRQDLRVGTSTKIRYRDSYIPAND